MARLKPIYSLQMTDLEPSASTSQDGRFLRQVRIRNYKSIGKCDVSLSPLTILLGRNGAGKSNFLDALRFLVDGLNTSLDHAIKSRGGIDAVRRRSTGHPRNFALEIEFVLPGWRVATFGFEIAARKQGGFVVKREHLAVRRPTSGAEAIYRIEDGQVVRSSVENLPQPPPDRLFLVSAAGFPEFRAAYDVLVSMGFYNLNPEEMKELQSPDAGELLHRDGSNIASVVARLRGEQPAIVKRIQEYLLSIVPGITRFERAALGPRETLLFRQKVVGAKHPWKFFASSMSDGTLRALGNLVAVAQLSAKTTKPISLVGIEEPEAALHPAAAGSLMDALREATSHTQVLVTSHSPDLLDQADPEEVGLLAVVAQDGDSRIAPIDKASARAIREHLYSAGELLRMDQLEPDSEDLARQDQIELFDTGEIEEAPEQTGSLRG